ncbi:bifunctional lysylphosphatidylglycerol flippase/synthetase MprF [Anaerovorax odorimutans]|uniref:bifunctional lysylphosphatidylglycerol flippase/synthetase MprF n=1 Tax=Anaerovorax odorimutans TaxID=109327 RepID=UPI000414A3D5|nr:bifunctional lysylphosphatidylglycerol flippase/synthetase MprF [Anaerovorax odorimutans]
MNVFKKVSIFILKYYKNLLKLIFAFVLILLILLEGKSQIQSIHITSTLHIIRLIPIQYIILFLILGIIASVSMVLYDVFGLKEFKYEIEKKYLFSISFVANSLNTLLGLGGLTGASVKTLLLKKHNIELKEMLFYNGVIMTSSITGLCFFSIFTLINFHNTYLQINQHKWLLIFLVGFSFYFIFYFFMEKIIKQLKQWAVTFGISRLIKLKFKLAVVSIIEWGLASVLFFTITTYFHSDLNFINVISVFVISSITGIVSFLPGGIGSFDLIAIIGLQNMGLTPNEALSVVILYRIFYYFTPSALAIIVFSLQVLKKAEEKGYVIKSNVYGQFVATTMTIIVITCGIVLLISALTPSLITRSKLISDIISIPFLQYSRSFSIAIGLMLIITSKEIFNRVKRSYYVAMTLLLAGGIFTFIKGLDVEELIFIVISMAIMRLSKTNFYRESIIIKPSHLITIALSVFILLIAYLKVSHILFSDYINRFHYPHIIFHNINAFIHSGIIVYSIFLIFIIVWYFKRKRIENDLRFENMESERLNLFLKKYKGHHLSHLIYLGDKNLFWAVDNQVLIAYSIYSNKAIVLGDPVGENSFLSDGIQEFQRFMDSYGYRVVFYEVNESNLSMYHDNGYYFFKQGEEAIVNLQKFEMIGSNRRNFRNIVKRFERDGYGFEVLEPPFNNDFLDELEGISLEWLGKRKEMGFSVGWFDRSYLQKAPIAIVKNISENKIIAFVSLMCQEQVKDNVGIDLMRFRNEVPNSTMDFIFIKSLIYFKEKGYKYFSLGVAPLSKVGYAPQSHRVEKMANFVSKHGMKIYSFEGLRKFKDKFDPNWEPRYLAYPQLIFLPALFLELSLLVNKNKKGVKN